MSQTGHTFMHLQTQFGRGRYGESSKMSKHGRRSKKAQNRRQIVYSLKTKILQESFRDPIWAETVCQTSHVELRDFGYEIFGEHFSTTFIQEVDNGYILSDSRGRGIFQR